MHESHCLSEDDGPDFLGGGAGAAILDKESVCSTNFAHGIMRIHYGRHLDKRSVLGFSKAPNLARWGGIA